MSGVQLSDEEQWRWPVLLLCVVVLVWAAGLFWANAVSSERPWVNHDVAFHSWLGFEILHGSRLYVDFNDSNPPGSQFLFAALLALTDLLAAPDFLVPHLFTLLVGLAGILLLRRALSGEGEGTTFAIVAVALLLVTIRGNFANNLYAGAPQWPYDFGQREQLFALLFFPYVIWRLSGRPAPRAVYIYLLLLGFVAVFKPYWPLLVVAVEAVALWRDRRREWSYAATLALGGVLPYVLLLARSPASFATFFGEVVPLHLSGGYAHYSDLSAAEFAASRFHLTMALGVVVTLVLAAVARARRRIGTPELCLVALLVLGSYATVFHQGKFWSYHGMVCFGAVMLPGAWLAARLIHEIADPRRRRAAALLLLIGLAVPVGLGLGNLGAMLDRCEPLGAWLVPLIEGRSKVMFLSMSVDYSYAPLLGRVRTVGPWSVHLDLPALLAIEEPDRHREALQSHADRVVRRIDEERPELLLFAPYRQALPPGTSLHLILSARGVVPHPDYERVPATALAASDPRLGEWIVYRRTAAALSGDR
jgi:hypothetical protein